MNLARYNKMWAALAGAVAIGLANAGLVSVDAIGVWIDTVIAIIATAGVYAVPNKNR